MKDEGSKPLLTLLTPTWNRAHLLPRLQRSIAKNVPLNAQIEWLIIDDGSTDGTSELINGFQENTLFPVRCFTIEHGGKHRALNCGFEKAMGQWILIIDSDDWFLDGAISKAVLEIAKAKAQGADALFLPMHVAGAKRQYGFNEAGRSVAFLERVNEETWFDTTFVFSSRICELRISEFHGETFLAEAALLYKTDPAFRFYLSSEVCVAVEYQPDGLSFNNLRMRMNSPVGCTFVYSQMLSSALRPALRLRALCNFGRFWWHSVLCRSKPIAPVGFMQRAILPLALLVTLRDYFIRWHQSRKTPM